jgi:hypothetical protein
MTRKMSRRGTGRVHAGAGASETGEQDDGRARLGRRALLTRGGVVAAGVVGAGAVAAAVAGPASAANGDPVLIGEANDGDVGGPPTELTVENAGIATFVIVNEGIDTTNEGAGPNLNLNPSSATGLGPAATTAGGDLTATGDGDLWFTHLFTEGTTSMIVPAPMHTEATANVYAPLETPVRILDTRTTAGRASIVNASGNLDSTGRLKAGKTIVINLDSLVYFAEAVFGNLTVTGMAGAGYLTVWSGATARPATSSIDFGATGSLANFMSSGTSEDSTTILNVVHIYAEATTHVILDVAGFTMPGFEYSKVALESAATRNSRLQRARQAMRNAARA